MKHIEINNNKYLLERDVNECFNLEEVESLMTDYFNDYDYVLGDYSYDKLRLKGFCVEGNSKCSEINNIDNVDDYIKDYCSYKANYFLLKKI